MKAVIEKITLENITRDDAEQLLAEIQLLCFEGKGDLVGRAANFPKLRELQTLLRGCFVNSHTGVHVIESAN